MSQRSSTTGRAASRWAWLLAALLAWPLAAQPRTTDPVPGEYRISGGRVDRGTYLGWRLFHTACYGCHGADALGTDLAPNLVERIKTLSQRDFVTKVLTSYRLVPPTGTTEAERNVALEAMLEAILRRERDKRVQIVMPAFEADPDVSPQVLDLYAYLSARADGGLGPGQPRVLPRKRR